MTEALQSHSRNSLKHQEIEKFALAGAVFSSLKSMELD